MANKVHVRTGDKVVVISGKDRGKEGKILKVFTDKNSVLVEGVNMATKHKKPRGRYQQGGRVHQEAPIHSSNVMIFCAKCDKATRTGRSILENGEKVRVCKRCGEIIDEVRYGDK